jgi:hypothetical protein
MADLKEAGLTDGARAVPPGVTDWAALSSHLGLSALSLTQGAHDCLEWLKAFDATTAAEGATVRDAFCSLLTRRLSYGPGERDAVFMEHQLRIAYPGVSATQLDPSPYSEP